MPDPRFITYARVSTQRQGISGLGLEAQQFAVAQYLGENQRHVIGEFVEAESGRKNDRPELAKALMACRTHGATLVVAKLDRLARNAAFLLALRDSHVDFVCADMPNANRVTIGIMAVVAEAESEAISVRTKAALDAAKRRGIKVGGRQGPRSEQARIAHAASIARIRAQNETRAIALRPLLKELWIDGARTGTQLAAALNARGILSMRGRRWARSNVQRLLRQIHFRETLQPALTLEALPTLDEALAVIRAELRRRDGHRARNIQIFRGRIGGRTLNSLAEEHGLTPERIRQLCSLEARRRRRKREGYPLDTKVYQGDIDDEIDVRVVLEGMLAEKYNERRENRPREIDRHFD